MDYTNVVDFSNFLDIHAKTAYRCARLFLNLKTASVILDLDTLLNLQIITPFVLFKGSDGGK